MAASYRALGSALDFGPDPLADIMVGDGQFVAGLKVHPELRLVAEIGRQSQCRFRADSTFAAQYVGNASRGDT
jgi:hypothetical protein